MAKPENARPKQAFAKKRDIFVLLALLALAGLIWGITLLNRQAGAVAVVSIGYAASQETVEIPLSEDGIHHIEGGALPVQLEVLEGRIRFVNSVCPDHDCEGFGWLAHDGEWGACLPAAVVVRVDEAA